MHDADLRYRDLVTPPKIQLRPSRICPYPRTQYTPPLGTDELQQLRFQKPARGRASKFIRHNNHGAPGALRCQPNSSCPRISNRPRRFQQPVPWLTDEPRRFADAPGAWSTGPSGVTVVLDDDELLAVDGVPVHGRRDFGVLPERGGVLATSGEVVVEIAQRGGHDIVRPRRPDHALRTGYRGTPTFEPDPRWGWCPGRFVPFEAPQPTAVGAAVGGPATRLRRTWPDRIRRRRGAAVAHRLQRRRRRAACSSCSPMPRPASARTRRTGRSPSRHRTPRAG